MRSTMAVARLAQQLHSMVQLHHELYDAMHYLTREAMLHSMPAHRVAVCARQWLPRLAQQLHSIEQLQHGMKCRLSSPSALDGAASVWRAVPCIT